MKLLKKPTSIVEEHVIGHPAQREVRFNPLGLLGIGPIATIRDRPARQVMTFAGRSMPQPLEIDFEDADAMTTCLEYGAYDCWKKKGAFTVKCEEDGWVYILHGLIPLECLRDNVWSCNIDYYEC